MTIAACYLSSEGIVFGADSTTTMFVSGIGPGASGSEHHFNFAQKIFQIGEDSTLAMTMWGLGGLHTVSYRTLIAQFADLLITQGSQSMEEVANRWNLFFWEIYAKDYEDRLQRTQILINQAKRTPEEDSEIAWLMQTFSGGFCLGGYLRNDRTPRAFEVLFNPALEAPGNITSIALGRTRFWGCPNLIERILYGLDPSIPQSILNSGKWSGTNDELYNILLPHCLGQPFDLPIREAIDWVHASIYTTIKTMKFSHMAPVCGGPVEIAAITTDRRFRWVRHKRFDSAIAEDGVIYV
jgi:hypothetical protein